MVAEILCKLQEGIPKTKLKDFINLEKLIVTTRDFILKLEKES